MYMNEYKVPSNEQKNRFIIKTQLVAGLFFLYCFSILKESQSYHLSGTHVCFRILGKRFLTYWHQRFSLSEAWLRLMDFFGRINFLKDLLSRPERHGICLNILQKHNSNQIVQFFYEQDIF